MLRIQSLTMHKQAGFTLIELMVVVVIMFLLMAGGFAAFINLNNRQTLVNSTRKLQLLMRTAQKQARVGSKPTSPGVCSTTPLVNYEVWVHQSGSSWVAQLIVNCQGGGASVETFTFDNGVISQSGTFRVSFLVLQGGVDGAGTFTLQKGTQTASFTVDQGGEISDITMGGP